MIRFILKTLIISAVFFGLSKVLQGIYFENFYYAILTSIALGIANTIIKPILKILSFPLLILSLGLFSLIINAGLLYFLSVLLPGFSIYNFLIAIIAGIVLSIVSTILNKTL